MHTTNRRQPNAYTIVESLVVLGILAVLTMVLVALFVHERKPRSQPAGTITEEPVRTPSGEKPIE